MRVSSRRKWKPEKPWPISGWLFWRTADVAAARTEKKYSRSSQLLLNKRINGVEESTTSDQVEEVEVGIGSDDYLSTRSQ